MSYDFKCAEEKIQFVQISENFYLNAVNLCLINDFVKNISGADKLSIQKNYKLRIHTGNKLDPKKTKKEVVSNGDFIANIAALIKL